MTIELSYLVFSGLLGLVHVVLTGFSSTSQFGLKYAMSPRDEQLPLTPRRARLVRALDNFLATFPIFAALVLVGHVADIHNSLTSLGVMLYFWARLVYIPCYVFAVPIRTLVWFTSVAGIVMLLVPLL